MSGYDDYGFLLEWDEIDGDLRDEKIARYIEKLYQERDAFGVDGLVDPESGEVIGDLADWDQNGELIDRVNDAISARFPIYF